MRRQPIGDACRRSGARSFEYRFRCDAQPAVRRNGDRLRVTRADDRRAKRDDLGRRPPGQRAARREQATLAAAAGFPPVEIDCTRKQSTSSSSNRGSAGVTLAPQTGHAAHGRCRSRPRPWLLRRPGDCLRRAIRRDTCQERSTPLRSGRRKPGPDRPGVAVEVR